MLYWNEWHCLHNEHNRIITDMKSGFDINEPLHTWPT